MIRESTWLWQGIILAVIGATFATGYDYWSKRDYRKYEVIRVNLSDGAKKLVVSIDSESFVFTHTVWQQELRSLRLWASELEKNKLLLQNREGDQCRSPNLCITTEDIFKKFKAHLIEKESTNRLIPPEPPKKPEPTKKMVIDTSWKDPLPIPDPLELCDELQLLKRQAVQNFEDLRGNQLRGHSSDKLRSWRTDQLLIDQWKERSDAGRGFWLQRCLVGSWEKTIGMSAPNHATYSCEMRVASRVLAVQLHSKIAENLDKCLGLKVKDERVDNTRPQLPLIFDLITEEEYALRKKGLSGTVDIDDKSRIELEIKDHTIEDFSHSVNFRYTRDSE